MGLLCPLCGPKLSAFLMIMSIWGIIFLGGLGFFFKIESMSLFPELNLEIEQEKEQHATTEPKPEKQPEPEIEESVIKAAFAEKATQCWIAAGMYAITLVLVFWQNKYNRINIL